MNPALISEKKQTQPLLIIDREGEIGEALAKKLAKESLVVLATEKELQPIDNLIVIQYKNKFPTIQDNFYSHILIIDDNFSSVRESLPAILKKAEFDKSEFLFITSLENYEKKIAAWILDTYHRAKIAIYGDIFTEELFGKINSPAEDLIEQARRDGQINIPGEGTNVFFPLFFNDLIEGILESAFGVDKENRVFCIFSKYPTTILSFAHLLQRKNPAIKIDFIKNKKNQKNEIIPEGKFIFENYQLDEKIKKINLELILKGAKKNQKKVNVKKGKRKVLPFFIFFILLLFLPLISTFLFSVFGLFALGETQTFLNKGDLENAGKMIKFSKNSFYLSSSLGKILTYEAGFILESENTRVLENKIEAAKNLSEAGMDALSFIQKIKIVLEGNTGNPKEVFLAGMNDLRNAMEIIENEKTTRAINLSQLDNFQSIIEKASSTINTWPELLGLNGKKTYLVLFQNNMELRPGGGFIGSYGILTLENGKAKDFTIQDVYNADGQLKGHVEPPYPIRRYLGQVHWFLRDSNFDVDFSKAGGSSAFFLNLETGKKVDGVIGVNLNFIKELLLATGPIYLPDYKEKVDFDNLYELAETHSEKNFFPGSAQKKEFLTSLFEKIRDKITGGKISYSKLLQAVGDSITKKDFLFAFNDSSIQNLFSVNDLSSTLWDQRSEEKTMINDFLGINEANLGVNKANYFVRKSVYLQTALQESGQISNSLNISFKNDSTGKGDWPGGDYKAYLRIILPENSVIQNIKIDDIEQNITQPVTNPLIYEAKGFKPPSGLEVEKYQEGGKDIYGFLIIVPIQKLKTIKIDYVLPNKDLQLLPNLNYSLKVFRQPGSDDFPFDFSFNFPKNYSILDGSSAVVKNPQNATFSSRIEKDLDLLINIAKK